MNKHMRAALVVMGLTLGVTACKGKEEAERKAAEGEKQSQEATLTAAKMRAEADETAKLKAARSDARMKLQKDFDAMERKSTHLREKAAKSVGTTKKNADAAIAELDTRRTAAKASLNRLADDASPAWDATKKTAEDDIAAVGRAVDALEVTIIKK
jgi:hypothetical protein